MVKYVGCFLTTPKNKTLIIRYNIKNFSKGKNRGKWGNAGGKIEETDEDEKSAMIRELFEETQINYKDLEIIKEKTWVQCHGTVRIFSLLVKRIPLAKLSDEHDKAYIVNLKDLKKFNLTYSFNKAFEIYKKNKK